MGMHFEEPMDEATALEIRKTFEQKIAVMDAKNVLLEKIGDFEQQQMEDIKYRAVKPVETKLYDENDIVEMTDGTKYKVTPEGWRKVEV